MRAFIDWLLGPPFRFNFSQKTAYAKKTFLAGSIAEFNALCTEETFNNLLTIFGLSTHPGFDYSEIKFVFFDEKCFSFHVKYASFSCQFNGCSVVLDTCQRGKK